jgi:putative membrane protein
MNIANRQKIATYIALAFHVSGFIAIAFFKSAFFISLTPLNLLVSAALIIWTQEKLNPAFIVFIVFSYVAGFTAEYIGVHTGFLFGNYKYGSALGFKWKEVPLIIGLQWTVTMYCLGIALTMLHKKLTGLKQQLDNEPVKQKQADRNWKLLSFLSTVIDGAMLAVLFDWVIEPAAIKLGYWQWQDGEIPFSNYISWGLVSLPVLAAFHFLSFKKQNQFAVNLLLIQFMFFLLVNRFF